MRLHAEYHDGFTERILRWILDAQDGTAKVRAQWFDMAASDHARRTEGQFPFDENRIQDCFIRLEPLQDVYAEPCDDLESCTIEIQIGSCHLHRDVYGGSAVRRWTSGPDLGRRLRPAAFSEAQALEIEVFLSVWDSLERDAFVAVGLPSYPPGGLVHVGHGTRMLQDMPIPCHIWINYDDAKRPIAIGEGQGRSFVACALLPHELLHARWADHVSACEGSWLVREIRCLLEADEPITASRLERAWHEWLNTNRCKP